MKNKPKYDMHKRIKFMREIMGITQVFVAEFIDVKPAKWNKIEGGTQHPLCYEVVAFCDLCKERGYPTDLRQFIIGDNFKMPKKHTWKHLKST